MSEDNMVRPSPHPYPYSRPKAQAQVELWSLEYLIDEVYLSLMNCKKVFCIINSNHKLSLFSDPNRIEENIRCNSGTGILRRKYVEQAKYKLYRMSLFKPAPDFVVSLRDLDNRVKEELLKEDEITRKLILREAVERIYELVDSRNYLLSAKAHLKVRLEK
jgi:hypothetical protein